MFGPAARRTQKVHANPATHGKKPKLTASRSQWAT
jgi:hypothetical protein